MYKNRSQGFTLIELLVVIAIIGILSAVVLASLSTARQKGNDAALQANIATIQTQAEIVYGNALSYGSPQATCANTAGTLWGDSTIHNAVVSATAAAKGGLINCNSSATAWAVSAQLTTPSVTTPTYWCVDSAGKIGTTTTATLAATNCP